MYTMYNNGDKLIQIIGLHDRLKANDSSHTQCLLL